MEKFRCPVGVFLMLVKGDSLIMQLRKNVSFSGMYGLVGGHLNGGESIVSAAIREAKEEVGIKIKPESLVFATSCHSNAGDVEYLQYYFWCSEWEGAISNLEPDRCELIKEFPVNQLPDNAIPYIQNALNYALNRVPFYDDFS